MDKGGWKDVVFLLLRSVKIVKSVEKAKKFDKARRVRDAEVKKETRETMTTLDQG